MTTPSGPVTRLPTATAREIFDRTIVPVLLADAFPHPHPYAVIVVGQPGSALESWTSKRRARNMDTAPCMLDLHSLRTLFPGYARLCRELGAVAAAAHIQPDVHRWLTMSVEFLRARRAAVIIEDDLPSPTTAAHIVDRMTAGPDPYPVEVALLAVPVEESRLALLETYQHTTELLGHANEPDQALHDHAYAAVRDIARWSDTESRIAATAVHSGSSEAPTVIRRTNPAATETRFGATWPAPAETLPMQVLFDVERDRGWDLARSRQWVRAHASLATRMAPRWRTDLADLEQAAASKLMFTTFWRSRSVGLTFGYYPVVTTTDVEVLVDLLADHDRVLIGVVDPHADPDVARSPAEFTGPLADLDRVADDASTMLTPGEQVAMWRAVLHDLQTQDRVDVTVIPRPELDPADFWQRFPATEYRLVLPAPPPHSDRSPSIAHAYRQTLTGFVHLHHPRLGQGPYRDLDSVRRAFHNGDPGWERQLARGALAAFYAADGPSRVLDTPPAEPGFRAVAALDAFTDLTTGARTPNTSIRLAIESALPPAAHAVPDLTATDAPSPGPGPAHGPAPGPSP
ncbi:zeta toxin family protein [Nocardia farcinica]|uniref:zeta toxin family protein n=1 Tax=Nocardia farcinica TaxID=37329 RepID=UPI0024576BB5|nr:zeta toxin family protein [Nocardia farcinica]